MLRCCDWTTGGAVLRMPIDAIATDATSAARACRPLVQKRIGLGVMLRDSALPGAGGFGCRAERKLLVSG